MTFQKKRHVRKYHNTRSSGQHRFYISHEHILFSPNSCFITVVHILASLKKTPIRTCSKIAGTKRMANYRKCSRFCWLFAWYVKNQNCNCIKLILFFTCASIPEVFKCLYAYSKDYDKIARLWIGPKLLVFLIDPRDVEIILSSHVHIDKSSEYRLFEPWLGNGLLISSGK